MPLYISELLALLIYVVPLCHFAVPWSMQKSNLPLHLLLLQILLPIILLVRVANPLSTSPFSYIHSIPLSLSSYLFIYDLLAVPSYCLFTTRVTD